MSSIVREVKRIIGTPKQWYNTITNPSTWTDTTPYSELTEDLEPKAEVEARAATAQAAADKAAKAVAQVAADKAAATAKRVADKAKTDEEAKTKATLLAKRRQSSRRYYTSGGAQGLLGQAPVQLKTLLGA